MKHASLFSGIGGFDLAAQWMGWTNVFSCEIEEFPRRVLKYHFPDAIHYEDIKQTDFTIHRGRVDVLSGGFPCQPYSVAGKRLGKNDERHLWPDMFRAIREINPRFIVGENVLGLVTWNAGMVLDEVHADLESEDYEVLTFVLPASGINAPHIRNRTWIVAIKRSADTNVQRLQERNPSTITSQEARFHSKECAESGTASYAWKGFPTQPVLLCGDDGLPHKVDGMPYNRWRNASIKAYGNAIVPQLAYRIFHSIQSANDARRDT